MDVLDPAGRRDAQILDLAGIPGPASRDRHRGHSLRDALVQARHRLAGVTLDTLLAQVAHDTPYVLAFSDGGYTTNLPVKDLTCGQAWVAFGYDGQPLEPEHGGPARLLVPHLYFWKSAKWVRGLELLDRDQPGFWESYGYHIYGDPWREQRYAGD
jgi:DMSO/TMAO reductase YedYZ molybdopterin-dependent catalytic subunit